MPVTRSAGRASQPEDAADTSTSSGATASSQSVWTETTAASATSMETFTATEQSSRTSDASIAAAAHAAIAAPAASTAPAASVASAVSAAAPCVTTVATGTSGTSRTFAAPIAAAAHVAFAAPAATEQQSPRTSAAPIPAAAHAAFAAPAASTAIAASVVSAAAPSIATVATGTSVRRIVSTTTRLAPPIAQPGDIEDRRPPSATMDEPAAPCILPPLHEGSVRSTQSRAKAKKIAKAKEELTRLKVQLAEEHLAALQAESDDEEDVGSVFPGLEDNARVNNWLDDQHPPPSAIDPGIKEQLPMPAQTSSRGRSFQDLSQLTAAISEAIKSTRNQPRYFELPTFSGSHHEWMAFHAAFTETMDLFSRVDNMNRLRRNLKGKAREAVESQLSANGNPSEIMKTLEFRFGRPDSIAATEIEAIKALPRLTESPRDICVFSSRVTNAVYTLQALQRPHLLHNAVALKLIIDKLTPTLRYRYYTFSAGQPQEEPALVKMEKFLKFEAAVCAPFAPPEPTAPPTSKRVHSTVNADSQPPKQPYTCPVCDAMGHSTTDCKKFQSSCAESRWDIAKSKRLCFRCLRRRTRTHSCKSRSCGINDCKYSHHRMLHSDRRPDTNKPESESD